MRPPLVLFSFLLFSGFGQTQDDAGTQAAMQAMQANQQAMEEMQRANQAASDQMTQQMMNNLDQASQNAQAAPVVGFTAKPKISVKPGAQKSPVTVKLNDSTRGAIMYYTDKRLDSDHRLTPLHRSHYD